MSIDLRKWSRQLVFMRKIYRDWLDLDDWDILQTNLITDMLKFTKGARSHEKKHFKNVKRVLKSE